MSKQILKNLMFDKNMKDAKALIVDVLTAKLLCHLLKRILNGL